MSHPRVRPDFAADERTQLLGWLQMQRAVIHWKCADLSDEDAHRPVLPGSPLMTMAGLVSHLRWTEHCWFEVIYLNRPSTDNPQFREDEDDIDWQPTGRPLGELVAEYERQCAVSDEIIAAHGLDDTGHHPDLRAGQANLRWVLLHMIEETARHAGHADTVRELLDGTTGYF